MKILIFVLLSFVGVMESGWAECRPVVSPAANPGEEIIIIDANATVSIVCDPGDSISSLSWRINDGALTNNTSITVGAGGFTAVGGVCWINNGVQTCGDIGYSFKTGRKPAYSATAGICEYNSATLTREAEISITSADPDVEYGGSDNLSFSETNLNPFPFPVIEYLPNRKALMKTSIPGTFAFGMFSYNPYVTYTGNQEYFVSSDVKQLTITCGDTAPTIELGDNKIVDTPIGTCVTVSVNDAENDPIQYVNWTLVEKPVGSIVSIPESTVAPQVCLTPDIKGEYVISAQAVSYGLNSNVDTVSIRWNKPPVIQSYNIPNSNPEIGEVSNITAVVIDDELDPITVDWEVIIRPDGSEVELSSIDSLSTSFIPDVAGEYKFRISVSDQYHNPTVDEISITSPVPMLLHFREGDGASMGEGIPDWDHVGISVPLSPTDSNPLILESHPGYPDNGIKGDTYFYFDPDQNTDIPIINRFAVQFQHTIGSFRHNSRTETPGTTDYLELPIHPITTSDQRISMRNFLTSKIGNSFLTINAKYIPYLRERLSPEHQKGDEGQFTCVGLIEAAAEYAGVNSFQGFIPNLLETISLTPDIPFVGLPSLSVPILMPGLLQFSVSQQLKPANLLNALKGFIDPADFMITDSLGRRLGHTASTGTVNEIPGSYYSGNGDVEYFVIPNPAEGEYQFEIYGLNENVNSFIGDKGNSTEYQGFLAAGDTVSKIISVGKPQSDAGINQEVNVRTIVSLNGSNSKDNLGRQLTYDWKIISSPANSRSVLNSKNTVGTTFEPDLPGKYKIQLVVSNGMVNSEPDFVEIVAGTEFMNGLYVLYTDKSQYSLGEKVNLEVSLLKSMGNQEQEIYFEVFAGAEKVKLSSKKGDVKSFVGNTNRLDLGTHTIQARAYLQNKRLTKNINQAMKNSGEIFNLKEKIKNETDSDIINNLNREINRLYELNAKLYNQLIDNRKLIGIPLEKSVEFIN